MIIWWRESSYLKCWWISQREREKEGQRCRSWEGGLGIAWLDSMIRCSSQEESIGREIGSMRSSESTPKTEASTRSSWILPWHSRASPCFLYRKTFIYGEDSQSPRETPLCHPIPISCCTSTALALLLSARVDSDRRPALITFRPPLEPSISSFLLATTINSSSTTGIYSTSKLRSGGSFSLLSPFRPAREEVWPGSQEEESCYFTIFSTSSVNYISATSFFTFESPISIEGDSTSLLFRFLDSTSPETSLLLIFLLSEVLLFWFGEATCRIISEKHTGWAGWWTWTLRRQKGLSWILAVVLAYRLSFTKTICTFWEAGSPKTLDSRHQVIESCHWMSVDSSSRDTSARCANCTTMRNGGSKPVRFIREKLFKMRLIMVTIPRWTTSLFVNLAATFARISTLSFLFWPLSLLWTPSK